MIKGLSIKNLEHENLKELWTLGKEVFAASSPFLHDWEPELIASVVSSEKSHCLVAMQRKKIIGFLISMEEEKEENPQLTVYWLAVIPPLQGRGVEDKLIGALINSKEGRSFSTISVAVQKEGEERTIFKKFNFTEKKQFVVMHLQQKE